MSVPVSPKLELDFTPPGAEGDPPPKYFYRAPTGLQREKWRARVASIAGVQPGPAQLRAIARAGIEAMCDEPADREALLALWDAAVETERIARDITARVMPVAARRADAAGESAEAEALDAELAALQVEAAGAALSPQMTEQLERLEDMLRQYHPPYARALERRQLWASISPRVACAMFISRWQDVIATDGQALPFKRVAGEVPDELLDRLPPGHVLIVGGQILTSLFASRDDAKKPASPSGSAAAATSSSTTSENPSSGQTATVG